ncbi:MAG: hypothetical protein P4N24_06855 [Acidobacteriota bacterium]|nr:hypothetical protein [Acidobacteriota bacterium]
MRSSNSSTALIGALMCMVWLIGSASWASASSLIGTWATSESFGDVVEAGTGATLRSSYSGQAYHFRKNGTYSYVLVASGQLMAGVYAERGVYQVKGNRLIVKPKTEDWTPNASHARQQPAYKNKAALPDEINKLEFAFQGSDALMLFDLKTKTRTLLHRIQHSQ